MAHLKWADMEEDGSEPAEVEPASVQTSSPVLTYDPDWTQPWLGVLGENGRPELPFELELETLNFMSWIFVMLVGPCTAQLLHALQCWQYSLRERLWIFRVHFAYAVAVFGIRF